MMRKSASRIWCEIYRLASKTSLLERAYVMMAFAFTLCALGWIVLTFYLISLLCFSDHPHRPGA